MNITLDSPAALDLPLMGVPPTEPPPLDSPLIGPRPLIPPPVRTGSVVLDDLLARRGFGVGQPLHLRGGGLKTQRSLLLGWIGAAIARRESCVLFDLEGALTEEAVERAGLHLIRLEELAQADVEALGLGDAKGYCRVDGPSTWRQLYRKLEMVLDTASSPTHIFVWGLDRLISNHIPGRATLANLARARDILAGVKKCLARCREDGHTVVFAHWPGGKAASAAPANAELTGVTAATGVPAPSSISPKLRETINEELFADFALGLDIGRPGAQRKCGHRRFVEVPVQPRGGEVASGPVASIELWHGSGQFKNP